MAENHWVLSETVEHQSFVHMEEDVLWHSSVHEEYAMKSEGEVLVVAAFTQLLLLCQHCGYCGLVV